MRDSLRPLQNKTVSCSDCRAALQREHACLQLEALITDLAESPNVGTISASGALLRQFLDKFHTLRHGDVLNIPCNELFYAKAKISSHFQHGKQAGEPLELLVDRLVSGECRLELCAVRYHGRLYVVEGNRRLWCLKEAEKRLGKELSVRVRVSDMYLGSVRQQDQRCPALQTFWEKYTTDNQGTSVSWTGELEHMSTESPQQHVDGELLMLMLLLMLVVSIGVQAVVALAVVAVAVAVVAVVTVAVAVAVVAVVTVPVACGATGIPVACGATGILL